MQPSAKVSASINRFLHTPRYIIAAALISLAAHILSAELVAYTLFAAVAVYVALHSDDLLPLTPLFLFCYITPSANNNPGRNEASVFSGWRGLWILALGMAIVVCLAYFIIRNRKRFFSARLRLLPGMLILCGAYLLSGIGSDAYPAYLKQNLIYCLLQCGCLLIPYFLLCGGVRWQQVQRNYLAWTGVCGGFLILAQIFCCYLAGDILVNGSIDRVNIFTGWGMYNNIGALLAMMIPFAFSLGLSSRKVWLGLLIGSIFLGGVLLTCSRGSILTGVPIFCICLFLLIRYAHNRKHTYYYLIGFILICILGFFFMRKTLSQWFSHLLSKGLDPNTRDDIYTQGIRLFKKAPILGNSFFSTGYVPWDFSTVDSLSAVIPPRWHNTVIQLLVCTGVVGLLAYLVHRIQTLWLFWKRRSRENAFILLSICVLLFTSLLDCHFFNLGPVLFYSVMLAFAEHK